MWGFLLQGAYVPPKQVSSRDYFAVPPALRPGLNATQADCDWFKEMHTTVFVSYPGIFLWCSLTLLHSTVEISLTMRDSWELIPFWSRPQVAIRKLFSERNAIFQH